MATPEKRRPREMTSRKADTRKSDAWIPESQLPMPNPVPGWRFKYIRVRSGNETDVRNVSRRFREGWKPVVASDHPELDILSDEGSRWPDGVEIGGLLLCKMPEERAKAREKYYTDKSTQELESVNAGYMNDQHASMPKHNESKSRTTFGSKD